MKEKVKIIIVFFTVAIVLCRLAWNGRSNKQDSIGPDRGSSGVGLTSMDFVSHKSDDDLMREIKSFDMESVSGIYVYIPEFTGEGMSFMISREDHPEEMEVILSSIYGDEAEYQRSREDAKVTESLLFDYNWYFLLYDYDMKQLALVFQYSDGRIVYDGHVFQRSDNYEEYVRPCVLKLKEENQEKLKRGEVTRRRVPVP